MYAQIPQATTGEAPVLKILDADNLTVLERLQLPLCQRQRFRIFTGATELGDFGAESCGLALLRR